ncbi:histidine kinase, partial [Streptomyces sp. HNM0574]|nr:histidine kinase [Streptomyces sp. HNM0574]
GLAAALQRGGPGGPGASGRPGAAPRGQVSGGTRPALPGAESGAPATNLFGDSPSGRPPQDGSAPNASGVPAPAVPSPGRPGESRPARPAGPSGAPPLPTRSGPAGELTGGSGTQGPSGATASGSGSAGPGDTAEMPQIGPGGTGPAELTEIPGASAGRPDAQGSAPAPRPAPEQDEADAAESGQQGPGDTAEFARPAFNTPRPGEGPDDIPGASAGRPGAEPAGNGPAAEDADAAQQRPSWAAAPGVEDGPRGHDEPESTGEYARPGYTGATAGGQDTDGHGYPAPQDTDPAVLPGSVGADAVDAQGIPVGPPAEADAPTPIFASMESNWFRGGTGSEAPRQAPSAQDGPAPYAPEPSPTQATRPGGPAPSVPPMPQRPTARGTDNGAAPTGAADTTAPPASAPSDEDGAQWGASPNDERWRRAEQVRQPAAGGVTTSGLPRRVPRANLVAGTAQQQSSAQSGPQVSRAPDDVRGRLTNLRRGIQQGRQAGSTDGRGTGPTYQQER